MLDSARAWLWFAIAATVVGADQLTKWIVEGVLPFGSSTYVLPVLDLVHVRNTGAAFSFLAGASGWQREFFVGIGLAASAWIVWMIRRAGRDQALFCLGLSLILGGALGNVVDRLRLGAVVDFLHFHWGPHYWPAFNVADSAISCGAALLIIDAFRQGKKRGPGETRTALE
ncbi:MAG: lipoprotein signal peptidase [Burkholderiales bacterium]|nr:lipoprotein signal peptidase [Burkholderiales bacterium]